MMKVSQSIGRRQAIDGPAPGVSICWKPWVCSVSGLQRNASTGILTLGFCEVSFPLQSHCLRTANHPDLISLAYNQELTYTFTLCSVWLRNLRLKAGHHSSSCTQDSSLDHIPSSCFLLALSHPPLPPNQDLPILSHRLLYIHLHPSVG